MTAQSKTTSDATPDAGGDPVTITDPRERGSIPEPAVIQLPTGRVWQMPPDHPLHLLAVNRIRKTRDLKIVITARDAQTGVSKTTGAAILGLSWNPVFTDDLWTAKNHATLDIPEYFDQYRALPAGSVLLMDEAEQLDARRSMQQENVNFSHDWMMMRKNQIISILTLPSPDALDSRMQQLSDVWINITRRGRGVVHGIKIRDYGSNDVMTARSHILDFPDVSAHPVVEELDDMKDTKIAERGSEEEVPDPEEVERETKTDVAQRMRDDGWTVREIADAVGMSRSWVGKYTESPNDGGRRDNE